MKGSHGHKSVSILELKDHGIRGGGPAADNLPADGKTEDQRGNKTHQDIRACLLLVFLGIYLVPSFGKGSCFYFFVSHRLVMFIELGEVAFYRKHFTRPVSALPSGNQRYMF